MLEIFSKLDASAFQLSTVVDMLKNLVQAMARSLVGSGLIQRELRDMLGKEYAAEVQALQENRLKEESLKKRATGLVVLSRTIVATRTQMNDPERHQFLWQEVAKPGIDALFQASQDSGYDPARFYVDALDFAAALHMLPDLLQGGNQSVAIRMVDTLQNLNIKFVGSAGYFGHTPYWTLYDYPLWRGVDREFTSVQVYWMALLIVDQMSSKIQQDWTQAILSADLDAVSALTAEQRVQLFAIGLPQLASTLGLAAVAQAAMNHPGSLRSQALIQTVTIDNNAVYCLHTLANAESMKFLQAFKSLYGADHPVQVLPTTHLPLSVRLQAATVKVLPTIQLIQEMIAFPRQQSVLKDAREAMPHLLTASL